MKNYEKYADEIREKIGKYEGKQFCSEFIMPYILKTDSCGDMHCSACYMLQMIWLLEDYKEPEEKPKEPETDWNKIEVNTPVLVKDKENEEWKRRYFAKYEYGRVHVWNNGSTSWSACRMYDYKYAKLAKNEEKPEVDWSKVEVDTPILVKICEDGEWLKKYFAKYEGGKVYAWNSGCTSWTVLHDKDVTEWKYAKLAESEEE